MFLSQSTYVIIGVDSRVEISRVEVYLQFAAVKNVTQGSYMSERVKFKDFSRTFKAVYQQIQGLNTEEGVRNQQNLTLNCSKRNFIMRSDMNMQNQFNKMSVLNVKQFQKISKN